MSLDSPIKTYSDSIAPVTLALPRLACDTHVHIFGPAERFAYADTRSFTPVDAPKETLFDLHRRLGIERCVIVQSMVHGRDNRVVVDAIEASGGRYLGVALVALTGWHVLDPLIALGVALHIVFTGFMLMQRSFAGLLDAAIPEAELAEVEKIFAEYRKRYGVDFHALRTRQAGARRFVNFHLLVPDAWPVDRAHQLSEEVESRIASLVPNAIEEMLRLAAPVRHFMRTVAEPTEVAGQQLGVGERLYLSYKAANLDPKVFIDPRRFDIHRPNANRQVSFGYGAHFCLGAPLARLETCVALQVLSARFPTLRAPEPDALAYLPAMTTHTLREFPVTWVG